MKTKTTSQGWGDTPGSNPWALCGTPWDSFLEVQEDQMLACPITLPALHNPHPTPRPASMLELCKTKPRQLPPLHDPRAVCPSSRAYKGVILAVKAEFCQKGASHTPALPGGAIYAPQTHLTQHRGLNT